MARTASLTAGLEGVAHVLRDTLLEVPPYQRSYSWSVPEVESLWDDLIGGLHAQDAEYFLGTMVLSPSRGARTTVIDGQQRLATVMLAIAAIRNEFARRSDTVRAEVVERDYLQAYSIRANELEPRMLLNVEDRDYFRQLLSDADAPPILGSHRRLHDALRVLESNVRRYASHADGWDAQLFRLLEYLEHDVQVVAVRVPSDADAYLIFETLNDRGNALSTADLLRNYIFSQARDDLEVVERSWVDAVRQLDVQTEAEALTSFVRHYWNSVHGAVREKDLYRELRRRIRTSESAAEFAQSLSREASLYAAVIDPEHYYWRSRDPRAARAIATIAVLGLEQLRPLLLAALATLDDHEMTALLVSVVDWAVRGVVVGRIGGGTAERYYADAAVAIRAGEARSVSEVLALLRSFVPGDEEFAEAFRRVRATRRAIARYYLVAIGRFVDGQRDPNLVTRSELGQYRLVQIEDEDPSGLLSVLGLDSGAWSTRLGAFAIEGELGAEARYVVGRPTSRQFLPEDVQDRHDRFASIAPATWPLVRA